MKRIGVLVLGFFVLAAAIPAVNAHPDPPGEVTDVAVTLTSVEIAPFARPEDGPDGNGEMYVDVTTNHVNHALENDIVSSNTMKLQRGDPNEIRFGEVILLWHLEEIIYTHTECTPRTDVTVGGKMWEEDITAGEDIAVGGVTTILTAYFTGGISLLLGFGAGVVANLDGNDDYGTFAGAIPDGNFADIRPVGGTEGPAVLHFFGSSIEANPPVPCQGPSPSPTPTPTPSPTPVDTQTGFLFDPLQEALAAVPTIAVERGNPGGLTPARLDGVRATYSDLFVGAGEIAAVAEIELARNFVGTESAVEAFHTGQSLRAEDPEGALELYRSAFADAASARAEGTPGGEAFLPFHLSAIPRTIATNKGDTTNALLALYGSGAPAEIVVEAPSGIDVTLTEVDAFVPLQLADIDVSGAAPGSYDVVFTAFGAGEDVSEAVVRVRVGPASPPTCGGRVPTMVGMPGDQVLRGTDGADVIVARKGNDVLIGRGGRDVLCGGAGGDDLRGGAGRDLLFGQGGSDKLVGGEGEDDCHSGPGRDRVLVGGDSGCEDFD